MDTSERRDPQGSPLVASEGGRNEPNTSTTDEGGPSNAGDDDLTSETFTYPQVPYLEVQLPNKHGQSVARTYELATAYFCRSELSYAEKLFSHCYQEIQLSELPRDGQIQVLMQLMQVRMHLRKYHEARTDLDRLQEMLDDTSLYGGSKDSQNRVNNEWRRWKAIWLMRIGHCYAAAEMFEGLKEVQSQSPLEVVSDLAFAYGYADELDKARANIELAWKIFYKMYPIAENVPRHETASDALTKRDLKRDSICVIEAEIRLFEGHYRLALNEATDSLRNLTRILGPKHFRTLSAASIKALCLFYCSEYREAEELCLDTLDIIVQELGRTHPVFIQAMTTLIHTFRGQNRFAEAISTGKMLYELVQNASGFEDPYMLQAGFQLAAAHLANGNYAEASSILEKSVFRSFFTMVDPDILRYHLELSLAYFSVGKTQRAMDLALHIAIHLLKRPKRRLPRRSSISECYMWRDYVPSGGALAYLAAKIKDDKESKQASRFHPWFTITLQHLATMLARIHDNRSEELHKLLHQIRDIGKERRLLLPSRDARNGHIINDENRETARLEFAEVMILKTMRVKEPYPLRSAAELLNSITSCFNAQLGGSNLETTRAYRELLIVYSMRALGNRASDEPVDMSLDEVESRSLGILDSTETTLGSYHPETLQSRLWCFTVKLLKSSHQKSNPDKNVDQTSLSIYDEANTIIARIRAPFVWQERYIEVLNIEKTVIDLLLGAEVVDKLLGDFLEYFRTDIERGIVINSKEPDEDITAKLKELQASFGELSQSYQTDKTVLPIPASPQASLRAETVAKQLISEASKPDSSERSKQKEPTKLRIQISEPGPSRANEPDEDRDEIRNLLMLSEPPAWD
ncbi:hypothetical protein PG996_010796 [Apiospora saccharicola]|uniref:Uncharacterized protein n=1 Tax=Apiospora saccharicola TaxID=335842 RepID=A0ABR1UPN1_9PEZI